MTKRLFSFLRKPFFGFEDIGCQSKAKRIFSLYLITFFWILISLIFIILIDAVIKNNFGISIRSLSRKNTLAVVSRYGSFRFIILTLLGPLIEECIFRLPLNFKTTSIAFSFSLCFVILTGGLLHVGNFDFYILRLIFGIILFFLLQRKIPESFICKIKRARFSFVFYTSVFLFAMMHIPNFKPLVPDLFYIYPIYVLPQFAMGLTISYARLRYGFFWGVALHCLINIPFALLNL